MAELALACKSLLRRSTAEASKRASLSINSVRNCEINVLTWLGLPPHSALLTTFPCQSPTPAPPKKSRRNTWSMAWSRGCRSSPTRLSKPPNSASRSWKQNSVAPNNIRLRSLLQLHHQDHAVKPALRCLTLRTTLPLNFQLKMPENDNVLHTAHPALPTHNLPHEHHPQNAKKVPKNRCPDHSATMPTSTSTVKPPGESHFRT